MNAVSGPVADAIRRYREGVRGELTDLPASEIAEILDDVTSHLEDLRGELGDDAGHDQLVERLGTPQAYAAELRAAAGYPPAPPVGATAAPTGSQAAYVAVAALVGSTLLVLLGGLLLLGGGFVGGGGFGVFLLAAVLPLVAAPALFGPGGGPSVPAVAALPVVQRFLAARPSPGTPLGGVTGFLASLQPAWWVVRALLAAWMVVGLIGGGGIGGVLIASVGTVPISVWLGAVTRRDRRWLWLVVPLNAFAAVVLFVVLTQQMSSPAPYAYDDESPASYYGPGLLQDGVPVEDIRPVDANGVPLEGVYLFDQNGRALDTYGSTCADDYSGSGVTPYPRGTVTYDLNGNCVEVPPGPFAVAIPTPPATTAPVPVTPDAGLPSPVPAPTTEQAPPTG